MKTANKTGGHILCLTFVFTILLALSFSYQAAAAETPQVEWVRQFGTPLSDDARGAAYAIDSTECCYIGGDTYGTLPGQNKAGSNDPFIRKYDADGNELWTNQFGTMETDYLEDIGEYDGFVYVFGWTNGVFSDQTNYGSTDAYIAKFDGSDGSQVWIRQFGSEEFDYGFGISVASTGIYVAGSTRGAIFDQTSSGDWDAYLCKYDLNGNYQWARQFGSSGGDRANSVAVSTNGVYVAGNTSGQIGSDPHMGESDVFVFKYYSNGTLQWARQFGSNANDIGESVAADEGSAYVTGYTNGSLQGQTSFGGHDAFLVCYAADGSQNWIEQFGDEVNDLGRDVDVNSSGVYLAGETDVISGYNSEPITEKEVFVSKYNPYGNEVWQIVFGTNDHENGNAVSVDATSVYLAGTTDGTFDGQTARGASDVFLAKITTEATVNTPEGYDVEVNPLILVPDQVNEANTSLSTSCFDFPYSYWSLFQTFTPEVSPLAGVDLLLRPSLYFPDDGFHTTIKIRSGTIDGDVLGEATTFIPGVPGPAPQTLIQAHFDFSPAISVNPGETYAIEWVDAHVEGYAGDILSWMITDYDSYPGGTMIGCMRIVVPDMDFIFTTYTIGSPVTLTFEEVTDAGTTSVSMSDEGEQAPFGFKLGDPPTYYDINTTAAYSGGIEVCVDYTGVSFEDEGQLILYHFENGEWQEAENISVDSANDIICGTVYSLSAFAVMEPGMIVEIDIKPGSEPNSINLNSKGVLPVAVLTNGLFDAALVEPESVLFAGAFPIRWKKKDVDGDADVDFLFHFKTRDLDLNKNSADVTLTGNTYGDIPFQGTDTVNIVPKGKKNKKWHKGDKAKHPKKNKK